MSTTSSTSTPSAGSEPRYAPLPKANTPPSLPIAQNPELRFVEPLPVELDGVRLGVAGAAAGVDEDDVVLDPVVDEATGVGEVEPVALGPVAEPVAAEPDVEPVAAEPDVEPVVIDPVAAELAEGVPPMADGVAAFAVPAAVVAPAPEPGGTAHVVAVVAVVAAVAAAGVAAVNVGQVPVVVVVAPAVAPAVAAAVVAVVAVLAFAVVPAVPDPVPGTRAVDGAVVGAEGVGRVGVGVDPAGAAVSGLDPFAAEWSSPVAGCVEPDRAPLVSSLELRAGTLEEVRATGRDDGPDTVHWSMAAPRSATSNAASTRSGRTRPGPGAGFEDRCMW